MGISQCQTSQISFGNLWKIFGLRTLFNVLCLMRMLLWTGSLRIINNFPTQPPRRHLIKTQEIKFQFALKHISLAYFCYLLGMAS